MFKHFCFFGVNAIVQLLIFGVLRIFATLAKFRFLSFYPYNINQHENDKNTIAVGFQHSNDVDDCLRVARVEQSASVVDRRGFVRAQYVELADSARALRRAQVSRLATQPISYEYTPSGGLYAAHGRDWVVYACYEFWFFVPVLGVCIGYFILGGVWRGYLFGVQILRRYAPIVVSILLPPALVLGFALIL